jgi:hypothetical protein
MSTALASTPALTQLQGQLHLVVNGQDGSLYHIAQTALNNGWSPFVSLGNPGMKLTGNPAVGPFNVIDGIVIQAVAVATDHTVHARTLYQAGGSWDPWYSYGGSVRDSVAFTLGAGEFNYLFGIDTQSTLQVNQVQWAGLPGPSLTGTPAVGASADGRLEVFAVSGFGGSPNVLVGALEHIWQQPGGIWSHWYSHGTPHATLAGSPAVAPSKDGRLELFVVGSDGALYHIWQTAVNNGWSGWYSHGNAGTPFVGSPALAAAADGRLELFVVGSDGALYHIWQAAVNNGWSGWYSHGTP